MKQVFLQGLALSLSFTAVAQTNDTNTAGRAANPGPGTPPAAYVAEQTPWSHAVDSMLQHVNKAQIPSGIL